jgi:hypothetical protein
MSTKKFPCKIEEIPVVGELVVGSAEKDINDFNGYSPLFTIDYLSSLRSKIEVCKELVKSFVITKELKAVTQQLDYKTKNFRITLNILERYLKIGSYELDVEVKDVGLRGVRMNITKGNIEGLMYNMRTSLVTVKRNLPALETQGLKPSFIDEIEAQLNEINSLNEKQNELTSKCYRLITDNMGKFSDLWNSIRLILNTAKVIYRGVDEVKLKDYYTFSQLKKRINAKF